MRGFLALGATGFNSGDLDAAEVAWRKALDIDDKNVEAHYDLGFLYFNRQPPDMAEVQEHWNRVVELDPEQRARADGEGPPRRHRQHGPWLAGTGWLGGTERSSGRKRGPVRHPGGSSAATPAVTAAPSAAPSATPQP